MDVRAMRHNNSSSNRLGPYRCPLLPSRTPRPRLIRRTSCAKWCRDTHQRARRLDERVIDFWANSAVGLLYRELGRIAIGPTLRGHSPQSLIHVHDRVNVVRFCFCYCRTKRLCAFPRRQIFRKTYVIRRSHATNARTHSPVAEARSWRAMAGPTTPAERPRFRTQMPVSRTHDGISPLRTRLSLTHHCLLAQFR